MSDAPRRAEIADGAELPTMTRRVDEIRLFMVSAVTNNAHRIHYDRDYARAEGHRDLVVHAGLQGSWMTELLRAHFGTRAFIRRFSYRVLASAYVNVPYHIDGHIAKIETLRGRCLITSQLFVRAADGLTAKGTGTVELPGDGEG